MAIGSFHVYEEKTSFQDQLAVTRSRSCNGQRHVELVIKEFFSEAARQQVEDLGYDEFFDGREVVKFATLSFEEIGSCNHSCGR